MWKLSYNAAGIINNFNDSPHEQIWNWDFVIEVGFFPRWIEIKWKTEKQKKSVIKLFHKVCLKLFMLPFSECQWDARGTNKLNSGKTFSMVCLESDASTHKIYILLNDFVSVIQNIATDRHFECGRKNSIDKISFWTAECWVLSIRRRNKLKNKTFSSFFISHTHPWSEEEERLTLNVGWNKNSTVAKSFRFISILNFTPHVDMNSIMLWEIRWIVMKKSNSIFVLTFRAIAFKSELYIFLCVVW